MSQLASGQAYPSPNSQGYPGGAYQVSTPVPGTYMVGSGGGGAGGSGGAGGRSTSGTYPPTPPGQGGSGKSTPEFPSPVLSLIPGFPQLLLDVLGSSGMLAGGGGGTKATIYYPYPHPTYNDYVRQGGSGGGGNGYQRIPTQTQLSERGLHQHWWWRRRWWPHWWAHCKPRISNHLQWMVVRTKWRKWNYDVQICTPRFIRRGTIKCQN